MPDRESLGLVPGARQACLLLVHGGFHGAWCWERLIVSLTERDVRVEAIEMPFTSFADDVAAVSTSIDRLAADGTPVVAVGHSMGGLHLTEAGAGRRPPLGHPPRLRHRHHAGPRESAG